MNTVSIEIPSAENSVRKVEQVRHRKFWKPLLSTAVAAVAALGMGLGANAALAAPTEISGYAHVDYVSLNYDGVGIELGSNLEDQGWEPAGTYTLVVPWSTGEGNDSEGTGYILPQKKENAESRNVPFAGFSGDESLHDFLDEGETVTLTLENVVFDPAKPGEPDGSVTVSKDGQTWFNSGGDTHDFSIIAGHDEAFHEHTKWVFSEAGTYTLTFSAEAGGQSATAQNYTFKVGL